MSTPVSTFRFFHEAMATRFEVRVRGLSSEQEDYAEAAREIFREVDRLEGVLSRFWEGSDLFRVNRLRAGESTRLSGDAFQCLRLALRMKLATLGAFDPAVGGVMQALRGEVEGDPGGEAALAALDSGSLLLSEFEPEVVCERVGVVLDLGAIGKGYALDQAVPILRRWGIGDALLIGGGSSVRSLGETGWEVDLAGDRFRVTELLRRRSIGGSGTSVQGCHIVDVVRRTLRPLHRRAWATADTAAVADALSTAAMTMTDPEIRAALAAIKDSLGEEGVVTLEPWEEGELRVIALG